MCHHVHLNCYYYIAEAQQNNIWQSNILIIYDDALPASEFYDLDSSYYNTS